MTGASPSSAQPGESALELVGAVHWDELLHDWQTRSEHDGGYSLLRCRVCGTEVVR